MHLCRCAGHDFFLKSLKPFCVFFNVSVVNPAIHQHDTQHAVKEHDICAGLQGKVQVGTAGSVCFAWICNNDFQSWILGLCIFNSSEQNGVCVGSIAACYEQAIC